jgi:hypothetical protein
MTTPHESILDAFEAQRAEDNLFQSRQDRNQAAAFVQEQIDLLGAAVHLLPRSTRRRPQGALEGAGVHPIDADLLDPQFVDSERVLNLRAVIEHSPSQQLLTKYGVDEKRESIFHFSFDRLQALGLVDEVERHRGIMVGDFILWDRTWYVAKQAKRSAYFALRTIDPLATAAFCDRYQHNVTPLYPEPLPCPAPELRIDRR